MTYRATVFMMRPVSIFFPMTSTCALDLASGTSASNADLKPSSGPSPGISGGGADSGSPGGGALGSPGGGPPGSAPSPPP